MIAALALALALFPMHGVVLGTMPGDRVVIRNDAVPLTLPQSDRVYRLAPKIAVRANVGIDGYVDRSTQPWTLRSPMVAAPFSPGLPETGRVIAVDVGSTLPHTELIDQDGRRLLLDQAFRGKVLLLSFVFTRCPDATLCPAISGKLAYMQSHLDPAKFAIAEISLDPQYDSPAILRRYGATYGANPKIWSLLTGTGSSIQRALDQFGINSLRVSSNNFIHNDKLFLVTPQGRVAYVVDTAGWDPSGVMAEARSIAGMESNPFERAKLSLLAGVVAMCGGSQYAGIVFLELGLVLIITILVTYALWRVARVLWRTE